MTMGAKPAPHTGPLEEDFWQPASPGLGGVAGLPILEFHLPSTRFLKTRGAPALDSLGAELIRAISLSKNDERRCHLAVALQAGVLADLSVRYVSEDQREKLRQAVSLLLSAPPDGFILVFFGRAQIRMTLSDVPAEVEDVERGKRSCGDWPVDVRAAIDQLRDIGLNIVFRGVGLPGIP